VAISLSQNSQSAFLSLEDQITFKQILHAIQNDLTDDQRNVVVLRFLEEFNLHETAAILGKREDHVRVIQNRAITALRKSLEYESIKKVMAAPRIRDVSRNVAIRPT
jgi:RNA polymerase sigma-70 factor (ECF subfamily)